MAFNDASCPKCRKKFGWIGRLVDKPACPKCGKKDKMEDLQREDEEMEAIIAKIFGKDSKEPIEGRDNAVDSDSH